MVAEQISVDGTRKWLLRLPGDIDGAPHDVECVYIPETDRGTLCISSQVGCTLNCSFCHTGTQRLVRNLTAGEIAGQVVLARDRLNDWTLANDGDAENRKRLVSNIVMMGMGEPLYNFEAVRDGLAVVADGDGLSISKRRITLSTSGVVPNIARAGAEIGSMLAVSLHAVTDELRDRLVPLNRKYPLRDLLEACRNYPGVSKPGASPSNMSCSKASMIRLPTPRRWCASSKASRPRSISFRSTPGPAPNTNARTGNGSKIFRDRLRCRLFVAGTHAARPRYPCRLRPAQECDRKALRPRASDFARHGDDRLGDGRCPHYSAS